MRFCGILLLCSICFVGCKSALDRKLAGLWFIDINAEVVERNNWDNILGNGFNLESDFTCDMVAFRNVITSGRHNSHGTWQSFSVNGQDSLIIDVKDHPLSGRYKVEFYKDTEMEHLKMRVSNFRVEFTCAKFSFQNPAKVRNW